MALFCIETSLGSLRSLILHLLLTEASALLLRVLLLNASLYVVFREGLDEGGTPVIVKQGILVCEQRALILIAVIHLIQDECKFNFIIISLIAVALHLSF